jgi:N-acetyl-alpha-D-glucosaminyl L-malate synthase BshA
MRIGITCWPTFGGSGAVATELGHALAGRGHEVHFICYAPPFRLDRTRPNVHFHEVEVSTYPLFRYPPYDLALASRMLEVMRERRLDVLHVHYAIPHAISAYLAREMSPDVRSAIVTTLHGTDITIVGSERAYVEVTRFGLKKSDAVTAVSEFLCEETGRVFGDCCAGSGIRVLPNFVDPEVFRPATSDAVRRTLAPEGWRVVTHMSNMRPVKRVRDVVHAFALMRREIEVRLVLVGDGPDLPEALDLAEELGVREDVVALGRREDAADLLGASDLYFLPTDYESFGLSALEALACEVPVIGAARGGLPEVVDHGRSGFLCEVGDRECMAAHALELLRDEERRRAFGREGRRRSIERYSTEAIVGRYESLYRELRP